MPKYFKKKSNRYVKEFDLSGKDLIYAETENMYVNYRNDKGRLESFPGYRPIHKCSGNINGIYDLGHSDGSLAIHEGNKLFSFRYSDHHRDSTYSSLLTTINDRKSFGFAADNYSYVVDGADMVAIDKSMNAYTVSQQSNKIYVPTTYSSGEEAEQLNLLTTSFKEEYLDIKIADLAYESDGLLYSIKSEAALTCSVVGIAEGFDSRVDIPNRKRINGKYYRVIEIADDAFSGVAGIKKVILGSGVKRVGKRAFMNCPDLNLAVMPDGIEIIDDSAFAGCSELSKIYIGVSCKSIYYNSFNDCKSTATIYFSDTYEYLEKCDGVGNLMVYAVEYSTKYTHNSIGVPIFTPVSYISSVKIGDKTAEYTEELARGVIKINYADPREIEGKSIYITGKIDTEKVRISERGVTFSMFSGAGIDAKSELLSCKGGVGYDGRAFLFNSDNFQNIVFASSFTREGEAHPFYFGDLDYFAVGSPLFPIGDAKREGGRLAISKPEERGGSIFLCYPRGEEKSAFGRSYPIIYTLTDTHIKSRLYEFDSATIYATDTDICRMKYSSTSAVTHSITKMCPRVMKSDLGADVIFTAFDGYLVVITKKNIYLGDNRLSFEVDGEWQFKWFPILDVGEYEGDYRIYYYADSAPTGLFIHPSIGSPAEGTVYSYSDEDGGTVYYVKIGLRKYAVIPGEESFGGTLVGISAAIGYDRSIIFITEKGNTFAFNTDKVGMAPKSAYIQNFFDSKYYKSAYAGRLNPEFYSRLGHRVRYSVTTAPYNGEIPHLSKSTIRGSLTAKLCPLTGATVCFAVKTNGGDARELGGITLGSSVLWNMDFGKFSFSDGKEHITVIPEKQEKWNETQITVYTEQLNEGFSILEMTLGFKINGRIKNSG